jgi:hypothetical protein
MTTINDPKGEAGSKKAPMWLLPPVALEQTAWVHKLGNEKYGPFNWRKTGVCATTYISAILRHLNAWRDGEDLDPESGISHIAHVATSCNILMDAAACGTLQDDRNKRPAAGISGLGFRVYPDIEVGQTTTIVPPADDHLTHVAAYMEDAGRQLQQAHAEKILSTEDPWLKLAKQSTPDQIEVGGKLVDLPPVPEGYSRWVYRGVGWDTGARRVPCFACAFADTPAPSWEVYYDDTANGVAGSHYVEAVPRIKQYAVRVVDHDIKPGDKVAGRLVRGEDFSGTVVNIIDIRGTKLFQFLDRASISEEEIYSITHA